MGQDDGADMDSSMDFKPMTIPQDVGNDKIGSRRIHIIGIGSIGTFVAHCLRTLPNPPPITLMIHREAYYDAWCKQARIIRLINRATDVNDEQVGYDVDLLETDSGQEPAKWRFVPTNETVLERGEQMDTGEVFISCLVCVVKGPHTVLAMRSIKHRVDSRTTICFIQNGLGQIEELNEQVFTDPATRPTYMLGIISHGVHQVRDFTVVHAGFGTTALGIYRDPARFPLPPNSHDPLDELPEEDRKRYYPTDTDLYYNITARYLLRTLTRSTSLAAAAYPYLDLQQLQLEKLAVNCIINPLTAILDVLNGGILNNEPIGKIERLLIAEISLVLRNLPELEGIPGIKMRFSADRLETLCIGAAKKTAANSSSTREDLRKLVRTELDYINGYIVRRGEEQGVKCVLNYMIMQLVKAKEVMNVKGQTEYVPYTQTTEDVYDEDSHSVTIAEGKTRLE